MDLKQTLIAAIKGLRSGSLKNEAQVREHVISPILRVLDWDNPEILRTEVPVPGGRADYVLYDNDDPLIFIEAKTIGNIDVSGKEQLFKYAYKQGVPFLVLTDGKCWDFYLSMARGGPPERLFYRLELQLDDDDKISEYMSFLEKHLGRASVVSGQARVSADQLLANKRKRTKARNAIPAAWRRLLSEPDETLRDLLAETVESQCGTKPKLEDVESFLKEFLSHRTPPATDPRLALPATMSSHRQNQPQSTKTKIVGYIFREEHVNCRNAIGTLVKLVTRFDHEFPGFMERFSLETITKKRKLLAKERDELFKDPNLVEKYARDLENGWWLGKNHSQLDIRSYIKTACSVAGVKFGSQLKLIEEIQSQSP